MASFAGVEEIRASSSNTTIDIDSGVPFGSRLLDTNEHIAVFIKLLPML